MSSFFGGNIKSGAPEVADVQQRKEEVKLQIQQELAVANAQLLIEKINENCFAKCVTKPSTSLSTSEQACLSSCVGLYSSAFDTISQKYVSRVVRERQNGLGDVKLE